MSGTLSLKGLVVIDFTHVLAGSACSSYLGLLGADVIKIETEHKGDAIRHRGGTDLLSAANGMSTSYMTQAAGKKSVCLDLERSKDRDNLSVLLKEADIFVENHVSKTMRKLNLDESVVMQRHPRLI